MRSQPFVILTTRLPPAVCGIGTYSELLRKHWPDQSFPVEYLVVDDALGADSSRDRVTSFHGDGSELARELGRIGPADLLLHYAGRAYQRFGCPVWMPGVLEAWKRANPASRLTIFVHELPGSLRVTSPHFWLGQINSWIVRRLASIADVLVTNTENHADLLRKLCSGKVIEVVPISSNLDVELEDAPPRVETEFVLFGLSFGRLQALQRHDQSIRQWQATGRLTRLHLVGPDADEFSRHADALIRGWPDPGVAVRHGHLPLPEVARRLQGAAFALTNASAETWSKSGTFMACAAHGCAIVISGARPAAPPLAYTVGADEVSLISEAERERRAARLRDWYQENADWPVTASRLATLAAG